MLPNSQDAPAYQAISWLATQYLRIRVGQYLSQVSDARNVSQTLFVWDAARLPKTHLHTKLLDGRAHSIWQYESEVKVNPRQLCIKCRLKWPNLGWMLPDSRRPGTILLVESTLRKKLTGRIIPQYNVGIVMEKSGVPIVEIW